MAARQNVKEGCLSNLWKSYNSGFQMY
jgi:hypothetical protein